MPEPVAARVLFYHLVRRGLVETVQMLASRAAGQGWRVMIRCPDAGLAERLDRALWHPEDSFLPHGQAGGGDADARQPVLIGPGAAANAARALMLVSGAELAEADLPGLERVWVLFDGADESAVAYARSQWTQLTGLGLAAEYWSDESGGWRKKTERPAQAPA